MECKVGELQLHEVGAYLAWLALIHHVRPLCNLCKLWGQPSRRHLWNQSPCLFTQSVDFMPMTRSEDVHHRVGVARIMELRPWRTERALQLSVAHHLLKPAKRQLHVGEV